MTFKTLPYCQTCKSWDKPLHKNAITKTKNQTSQSMMCRDCRREKQKDYYARNKEKCRAILYKSIAKHKHKQRAREKLNYRIRKGDIIKPECCEGCGEKKTVWGHHEDYSKPLDVNWLCHDCHSKADKERRARE